jgi:hypothetical protein
VRGQDAAAEDARELLAAVDVYALPSDRPAWRRGVLKGLTAQGLDPGRAGLDPANADIGREEGAVECDLALENGSRLTPAEVARRASSVAAVGALLEASQDGYFRWEPIVAGLAQRLGRSDLLALADLFQTSIHAAEILAALSGRLLDLGDPATAWRLGERALEASPDYSWHPRMGTGRLVALGALVRADPERGRAVLYRTLVADLTSGAAAFLYVALSYGEILPLLAEAPTIRQVWAEIERYLVALIGDLPPTIEPPACLDEAPAPDTAARALAELLAPHLIHPVHAVAEAAKRAFIAGLLRGELAVRAAAGALLAGSEADQEHALAVLEAAGLRDPAAVAPLGDAVARLVRSPNYAVRRAALEICATIGRDPRPISASPTPLPAVYRLALPPRRPPRLTEDTLTAIELARDWENPAEVVLPFAEDLRAVAEMAGLPEETVYYRAAQIMEELAAPASWSREGEERLRADLAAAGLRLPFRRPRSGLARRALFHVVAELQDAGELTSATLRILEPSLRWYDPTLLLTRPLPRPLDIGPIIRTPRADGIMVEVDESWLVQIDDALHRNDWLTGDGWVIVAEATELRQLDWEAPAERRWSVLCGGSTPRPRPADDFSTFFTTVVGALVPEYPNRQIMGSPMSLVVRNWAYWHDSAGSDWLALNPAIGYELGWVASEGGLFRWVDGSGRAMAESRWWADGPIDQSPPHLRDEVGAGWLVVVTPAALELMLQRYRPLKRWLLTRRAYRDRRRGERKRSAVRELSLGTAGF